MGVEEIEKLLRDEDIVSVQAIYARDPHRPRFHFAGIGWMNDINGLLFWKGRYHLFYQANPFGAYWKDILWGHASSADLVNWEIHPVILRPTPGGYDRSGIFSGHAFLDANKEPMIVYYGNPDGICLAMPEDPDDPLLLKWKRHPSNPVIRRPGPNHPDYGKYIVYDPARPWIENGEWRILTGNSYPSADIGEGDVTWLFKSSDLVNWHFEGSFYKSRREWTTAGEDCAVPLFFPLGGKHILMFSSHVFGEQYYTGAYIGDEFFPEKHDRISVPGGILVGPIILTEENGRTLHTGWIPEARDAASQRSAGWSGVMSMPWELSLDADDLINVKPAGEILALRSNERTLRNVPIAPLTDRPLEGFTGDTAEIRLTIDPGNSPLCGLKVRSSGDGREETGIYYDAVRGCMRVDLRRSSLDSTVEYLRNFAASEKMPVPQRTVAIAEAPFRLREGELLELDVFLDRSVLEIFANGRYVTVHRIYPTLEASKGISLFSAGGNAAILNISMWNLDGG